MLNINSNTLFINKYKPNSLEEFKLSSEFLDIIKLLIQLDKLNILFIGNPGSGKTTLLNIIVKEYYKDIPQQLYSDNILQINNLKEQGISYYRNEVKIFCQTCSIIKNKKKILLLDDIDIINDQSQQIFRNFIDKYSHNVHFISSCSSILKVIEGIQSRFYIIRIEPIQINDMRSIMDKIVINENIKITDDAKEFILVISNNTCKVLINYIEKFKLLNKLITLDIANNICTNISFIIFQKYTDFILNKNFNKAIEIFLSIHDSGYSVMDILDNYFYFVKTNIILDESYKYKITSIICKYINNFYNIHEDEIELSLFTNDIINII
jgi:DNA polymerase III delta prime subunit